MADPRNLTYWRNLQIEAILNRKKTKCSCGGSGDISRTLEEGVTVRLCQRCDDIIRYMVEEPRVASQLVG